MKVKSITRDGCSVIVRFSREKDAKQFEDDTNSLVKDGVFI